ncbi:hypothetical protein B484DRAFT_267589, partial [Ochromonadaceae sp. CCMP2298]
PSLSVCTLLFAFSYALLQLQLQSSAHCKIALLDSMATMESLAKQVEELKLRRAATNTNRERRILYSDSELLIMEIDSLNEKAGEKQGEKEGEKVGEMEGYAKLKEELEQLSAGASLDYVRRKRSLLMKVVDKVDEMLRMLAVWLILAAGSVILAFPCLILAPLDYLLVSWGVISVFNQAAVRAKILIAGSILVVSGTHVDLQGVKKELFAEQTVLGCFSHASSMDAFIITATIPVRGLTV